MTSYIFLIQISLTFIFMPTKNILCFPWLHKHSSPRSHESCMPCLALINHFNSISGEIAPEMVSRFLCWHGRGEWGLNHGVRFDLSALDWNREGPRHPRRSCNLDWPQQMDGQQSDSYCNQFSLESDMNQRSSAARLRPVWVFVYNTHTFALCLKWSAVWCSGGRWRNWAVCLKVISLVNYWILLSNSIVACVILTMLFLVFTVCVIWIAQDT